MQTFFNPTTPFFDAEGHPMVGTRVSFLDLSTNASLIELTDSEGTPLPNPLFTGSDGRLRLENGNGAPAVPCIADGLSYKVVVAKKTGVEPIFMGGILQNPEELYEEPFIAFVVTAMGDSGNGADTAIVGSVADVRLADKSLGAVVCSGYYEKGDCPARVFTWVESQEPPQDNGINILRNPEDNAGYWKMSDPPAGTWDVRMAGLSDQNGASINEQRLSALLNLVNGGTLTAVRTVYFPAGTWYMSSMTEFQSLIVEKGARFVPADNVYDRRITAHRLENRGGKFCAYGTASADKRVRIFTTGTIYTSWFEGTLEEFLQFGDVSALDDVDEVVFDSIDRHGSTVVTIDGKRVVIHDGVTEGNNIKFRNSFVFRYEYGQLTATSFNISSQSAGLVIDLSGIRMGDSSSNVEINHSGMVAKNAAETFTSTLDYAHLEFTGTQAASEFTHAHIRFGATGNCLAELGATGLTVSKGTDASEGSVTVGHDGIDSSAPLDIKKGATTPWYKKNVAASEISSGVFELGNDPFSESDRVFVNAQFNSDNATGYAVKITATPTEGRVVRIYCNCDAPYDMAYASTYLVAVMNTNNIFYTTLRSGGSITLRAKNNGWVLDPWSV